MSFVDGLATFAVGANAALATASELDSNSRKKTAEETKFAIEMGEKAHKAGNTEEMARWAKVVHKGFERLIPNYKAPALTGQPVTEPTYNGGGSTYRSANPNDPMAAYQPVAEDAPYQQGDITPATGFRETSDRTYDDPKSRNVFDSLFKSASEYEKEAAMAANHAKYESRERERDAKYEHDTAMQDLKSKVQYGLLENKMGGEIERLKMTIAGQDRRATDRNNTTIIVGQGHDNTSRANNAATNTTKIATTNLTQTGANTRQRLSELGKDSRLEKTLAGKATAAEAKDFAKQREYYGKAVQVLKKLIPTEYHWRIDNSIRPRGQTFGGKGSKTSHHFDGMAIDFGQAAYKGKQVPDEINKIIMDTMDALGAPESILDHDSTNSTGPHHHYGGAIADPAKIFPEYFRSGGGIKLVKDKTTGKMVEAKAGVVVDSPAGGAKPRTPHDLERASLDLMNVPFTEAELAKLKELNDERVILRQHPLSTKEYPTYFPEYNQRRMTWLKAQSGSSKPSALHELADALKAEREARKAGQQ